MINDFIKRCCIFSFLMLLGCSSAYRGRMGESPQSSVVSGRVTLEAGRGLEDVAITLIQLIGPEEWGEERPLTLDERGRFRAENLPSGGYYLAVNKPRYDTYGRHFYLAKGDGMYLDVELSRYSIPDHVEEVLLVGDFVDWDSQRALSMTDEDEDGIWKTSTSLPPGRHSYKYIINGLRLWFIDINSEEYEPDGFGYYNSIIELSRERQVDFILDTNDPWFRRRSFETCPVFFDEVGRVTWEPEEPRPGQSITITYDPQGSSLEGAKQVILHWGVNGWTVPQVVPPETNEFPDGRSVETPMEQASDGTWRVEVPTDKEVWAVDFVFTDGEKWDNNRARDWHVPVR